MNSAIISAIVITEPQVRYTSGTQKKLAEFFVEVPADNPSNPAWTMKVVCWNDRAIEIASGMGVNQPVLIEGRLELDTIERPEGFKEKKASLTAEKLTLLDNVINLNQVFLVGRTGGDPELKFFESGSNNAKMTLAVNRGKNDKPYWFDLIAWGKTAGVAGDYVRKGKQLAIQGSLTWEVWTDRNTQVQRSKPVIKIQSLELLGSARDGQQSPAMAEEYAA